MANPPAGGSLLVRGANVVGFNRVHDNTDVLVVDSKIVELGKKLDAPAGVRVLDVGPKIVVLPGFLDVHIHGGGGADTMDATSDALRTIARTHARYGTTGFLATTMTQSRDAISAALVNAHEATLAGPEFCPDGAQILGIHLEGPYINPKRPGAQLREFVRDYDPEEFAHWLSLASGSLKRITLAPERPGGHALIDACRAAGIAISFGHTDATFEEIMAGFGAAGEADATHLFNAMPGIHHRDPGPIPAFLSDSRAHVEIIADGHHLHPAIVAFAVAGRGPDRVLAITDAMAGAGATEGVYHLGGHAVTVANGRATLADGTLAGSVLTMNAAARNLRNWCKLSPVAIAHMTSTNAAERMGWSSKGRVAPGWDADLTLVDDNLNVRATIVAGRVVYEA